MTIFKKILTTLLALHFFAVTSIHASSHSDSPTEEPLLAPSFPPHPFFIDSERLAKADWWSDSERIKVFPPFMSGANGLCILDRTGKPDIPECTDFKPFIPAILIRLPDDVNIKEVQPPTFTIEEDPIGCCAKQSLSYTITVKIKIGTKNHTVKVSKPDKGFWKKIYSAKDSEYNACWRWTTATTAGSHFLYIVFPGHPTH